MIRAPAMPAMNWRYLAALPFAAIAIHIVTTLIAMGDTSRSAYHRLAPALGLNVMQMLKPIGPGHQPLPFMSPDARYAMCRFDTSKGPVAVSAVLPDQGWNLGVYRADGTSAYFAAAAPGKNTDVALTIVPVEDRFLGLTREARLEANAVQVPSAAQPAFLVAAREGLVVVRAPDKGLAYRTEVEAVLAKAGCTAKTY